MKTLKHFFMLSIFCMISLAASAEVYSGWCGGNAKWSFDTTTGLLSITGSGKMTNYYSFSDVPWYNYRNDIISLSIGDQITSIGDNAFSNCSGLISVTIPNSVTSIGKSAFSGCSGLTSVTIPNSVTSIGSYAFYGCSGLTSVTIPNSVTEIGGWAFWGCSGLTNPVYNNTIFAYMPTSYSGSYSIPDGITTIAGGAFAGCSGLTSVTIPNSVTSIGEYAFSGCSGLTSVTIPNSVTSIENSAFSGCSGLTSVTIPNSVTSIGSYAFENCSGLIGVTIPNSVTSIGEGAFRSCSGLTSVTIPNSVTEIGYRAFEGCNKIAKIEFNANCQYSNGFSGFSSLKEVIVGDSMTILNTSFSNCKNLTKLTLGKSLQYIRQDIFSGCSSLKEVHSRAVTPPYLYPNVFKDVPLASATLYVPMSAKGAYAEATTWKDFGTIVSDTPAPVMHKIYIEVSKYGKVSYLGNNVTNTSWDGNFEEGDNIVLKITPNDGAKLTKLLVNGMNMTSQVKDNQLILEGMETDVMVKATFEVESITLTIATSEGTEKTFDVEYGAQFTFMLSQYTDNVEKVVFNDVDVTADVVTEEVAIPLWQLGMYEGSDDCSIQKYTTPAIISSSRLEVTYKLNHPLGDTNLDGKVNVNDITKTAEIILLRAKAEMKADRF